MKRKSEQEHFSGRLKEVLRERGHPVGSATFLMREFNRHSDGLRVTSHAARKWLLGDAIPTQDKLVVLSRWLGVTAEWLRFDGNEPDTASDAMPHSLRADALAEAFDRLREPHRQLLEEMARLLGGIETDDVVEPSADA